MLTIENVYSALFAFLSSLPGGTAKTLTRRLQLVEDVDTTAMPYVGQLQITVAPGVETFNGVASWVYRADWYIYVSAPNMDAPTTPLLNPIVQAVRDLFPQEGDTVQMIVNNTTPVVLTFDGAIEFFEGLLDTKSVARIPVKMLVPVVSP